MFLDFVLGSRLSAYDEAFSLKIRCFHSFNLLILAFYLPLVVVYLVGIWLLLVKVVTTMDTIRGDDRAQ